MISAVGWAPLRPAASVQSPAQSLVPLTVPTSLQPMGARGFASAGALANPLRALSKCTRGEEKRG